MKILTLFLVLSFSFCSFANTFVLNCNTESFNKSTKDYNFEKKKNRIFLVTVNQDNKEISLFNVTKNQEDINSFYILVDNNNYIFAVSDFSSDNLIWNDMITIDLKNNLFSLMSYVGNAYTIHNGKCKIK